VSLPTSVDHGKRILYTTLDFAGPDLPMPNAHEACQCNEYQSLRNRVLMRVPPCGDLGIAPRIAKHIGRRLRGLVGQKISIEEATAKMPPQKRKKYIEAYYRACKEGIRATVKAFVKYERVIDWEKDPRMIQFRDAGYSAHLACFLKPIEHGLYSLKGDGKLLPKGRLVAKGRNPVQRARDIKVKWEQFNHPVALSIDCSRFDAHVQAKHLDLIEHAAYRTAWNTPELTRLLRMQLLNRGTTSGGLKYVCPGGRMSGDMNTALGNCVLMICLVGAALQGCPYQMYDDGDDCLLFCEQDHLQLVSDKIEAYFTRVGFNVKIENVATEFNKIFFCQSRPIQTVEGWIMVRSPQKILGFGVSGTKFINNGMTSMKQYIRALGMCGYAISRGVPVLQKYYYRMIELTEGAKFRDTYLVNFGGVAQLAKGLQRDIERVKPLLDITHHAREQFAVAFGISIAEQEIIEAACDNMCLRQLSGVGLDHRTINHQYGLR
jgi:hypothetical protein